MRSSARDPRPPAVLNEASRWRLRLAERIVGGLPEDPALEAVAVAGSVARGCADRYSDVEILLLWREEPSERQRGALFEAAPAPSSRRELQPGEDGGSCEDFTSMGVKIDAAHWTLGRIDAIMSSLLDGSDIRLPRQRLASDLQRCLPLRGEGCFGSLRRRLDDYPDVLVRAAVRQNLQFGPQAWLERLAERDDVIALHEILLLITRRLVGVLLALNRTYHPGYKWIGETLAGLRVAPPAFQRRLLSVLTLDPARAAVLAGELIVEVLDLVDGGDLPDIGTTAVRERLAESPPLWPAPPPQL